MLVNFKCFSNRSHKKNCLKFVESVGFFVALVSYFYRHSIIFYSTKSFDGFSLYTSA